MKATMKQLDGAAHMEKVNAHTLTSPGPFEMKENGTESDCQVENENLTEFDPNLVSRTVRKIDFIIIPVMTVLLAFCFIDRTNIGLAAVAGMPEELEFKGYQYSIALLVFFPGYALFVMPSNYILQRTSVRYWLTFLSITFGLCTLGTGLIRNYAGLVAMRVLLGACEAGVYPTIIVVASSWYTRYNLGKRITTIVCSASLISSLAGVLAYAFSRINTPGYAGWRWIFILEGAITILVTMAAFFVLDEYPKKSKFLSSEQRKIAVSLITNDREENDGERLTVKALRQILLRDWEVWIFAVMYMLCVTTTYAMAYFVPLILTGQMGFSGALSLLLSTPPYFYAFIVGLSASWYSDRIHMRSPFIIFFSLNVMIGIALVRWGPNTGSQYLGVFFTISGALVNSTLIITFGQNNAPTRVKRSISSGLQLTMGAVGGIIGSTVFRSQDAPSYTPGVIVIFCAAATIMCLSAFLAWHFRRQNQAHADTGRVLEGQEGFTYTL